MITVGSRYRRFGGGLDHLYEVTAVTDTHVAVVPLWLDNVVRPTSYSIERTTLDDGRTLKAFDELFVAEDSPLRARITPR